jgi:hypothetical protein
LVCSNGLVIAIEDMKQYNLNIVGKHTASILHSFEELDKMLKFFCSDAKQVNQKIVQKYELLGGRIVANVEDRIKEVLSIGKIIAVENQNFNTVESIAQRIRSEANNTALGYNGKVNDWLIYNGVNGYIFDDTRNIVATEKRIETDSKVFEYMLSNA